MNGREHERFDRDGAGGYAHDGDGHAADHDPQAPYRPRILFAPIPPRKATADTPALEEGWWVSWIEGGDERWFAPDLAGVVGLAVLGAEEELGLEVEMGSASY